MLSGLIAVGIVVVATRQLDNAPDHQSGDNGTDDIDAGARPALRIAGTRHGRCAADLRRVACGVFMVAEVTPLAISSTDIRRRLAAGLSIRYLVPGVVHRAIAQQMSQH